jgi:cobalt/nickel transport system permease protein
MHIPDAVLDPKVAAVTGVLGAAGLVFALRKLERQLGERTAVLLGTMSAFVFAGQMVNFPVGPGVSGHLLGGVLSAVVLGPWGGAVVIAAVLLVQCFLFGDGGLTALGANFVNMGLIGAAGGYAIYAPLRRAISGPRGVLLASMAAAWFSVLLASGAFALELGASGHRDDFFRILSWMALVHALIGLGEAVITGIVVRFILLRRPDLLEPQAPAGGPDNPPRGRQLLGSAGAGLAIALAITVFFAPFASESPDGLEFVGRQLGFLPAEPGPSQIPAPMPDYELALPGADHVKLATALAGAIGTLVVFAIGWGMARSLPNLKTEGAAPDVA